MRARGPDIPSTARPWLLVQMWHPAGFELFSSSAPLKHIDPVPVKQLTATTLSKIGKVDLAWIVAEQAMQATSEGPP